MRGWLRARSLSSPSRDGLVPAACTLPSHIHPIHPHTPRCSQVCSRISAVSRSEASSLRGFLAQYTESHIFFSPLASLHSSRLCIRHGMCMPVAHCRAVPSLSGVWGRALRRTPSPDSQCPNVSLIIIHVFLVKNDLKHTHTHTLTHKHTHTHTHTHTLLHH